MTPEEYAYLTTAAPKSRAETVDALIYFRDYTPSGLSRSEIERRRLIAFEYLIGGLASLVAEDEGRRGLAAGRTARRIAGAA